MMRSDAKVKPKTLHADGGPTRNKFLMQFTADLTRTEIKVAEVAESSAWVRVTLNGLLGLGVYKSPHRVGRFAAGAKLISP